MSVETPEFAAMARRVIRALGRRVIDGDEPDLAELVALRGVVNEAIAEAVHGQRTKHGRSWSEIAAGLGTTRQAAQQRYGHRDASYARAVLAAPHRPSCPS